MFVFKDGDKGHKSVLGPGQLYYLTGMPCIPPRKKNFLAHSKFQVHSHTQHGYMSLCQSTEDAFITRHEKMV